uniref:Uncharacterized protein n=1 Tax=Nelumbo nucifera TaxID=4432 RepID=A0A822Y1B7_NELNU|nr:TPA_asm: hypothetical protein HUJ06_029162 [Nelumbo nucifera]
MQTKPMQSSKAEPARKPIDLIALCSLSLSLSLSAPLCYPFSSDLK